MIFLYVYIYFIIGKLLADYVFKGTNIERFETIVFYTLTIIFWPIPTFLFLMVLCAIVSLHDSAWNPSSTGVKKNDVDSVVVFQGDSTVTMVKDTSDTWHFTTGELLKEWKMNSRN